MLDLTIYLQGPTEEEFEFLLDLYEAACPTDRLIKFKIAELPIWSYIAAPRLTMQGRSAATARIRRPYFEPSRERIRQGRAFEAQYWDGLEIDEPSGSWSLNCQRAHWRSEGLFAFARVLVPLETDPDLLVRMALAVADNVALHSGHGGLVFVYEPNFLEDAFDAIYARARRFWGVDIEHMNGTLRLIRKGIKAVNWITIVGREFRSAPGVREILVRLADTPAVTVAHRTHASVFIAGPRPVPGDQHRPDSSLDPYYAIANALGPLFLDHHPDFPGDRFLTNGNTVGWIRRFIDPTAWR
ncbi:type VI immunity family protein [Mesorhizobium sp. L-8-3]|uniref:type VI immunity family protein n=1 Tax=Mesorhizobium sp. L-8-3 TaxID=2744522 RepID=UPI001FD49553|nr:type VI immunity family protein [Mesorhizobium sp. L-8-3]